MLWDNVRTGAVIGHGREGFYFGENGEHLLYDAAKAIGAAMVELGRAKNDEPTTFTKEELDKYFGGVRINSPIPSSLFLSFVFWTNG